MIPEHTPLPAGHTFPHPTSTQPYWRTHSHPLDSHRSTLDLPPCTDIAIIGSGMSGVSTAYHILQLSDPASAPSITILEARQLCSGATGRNGGHLKVAVPHYSDVLEKYGPVAADEMADFHVRQIYAMKEVVERESLDCDFLVTRSFDVFMDQDQAREEEAKVTRLRDVGVGVIGREVEILPCEYVEAVTGVRGAAGARSVPAAQLWPYKFVAGLMSRIIDRVNLQTHTVVRSVESTPDEEGYYQIVTQRGVMRARKVVFASNAYTAGVVPSMEDVIVPCKGTASSITQVNAPPYQRRTYTYNICKDKDHVDYLNHRLGGVTIIGGAREVFEADQNRWLATVDDSTLIEEQRCREYFTTRLKTYYADWVDAGAQVDKIWSGIMGYTHDSYPLIGALPDRTNQFILAGFNGAGMLNIFLSSKGLARMIVHGDNFERTGIPRVYKVVEERLRAPSRDGTAKTAEVYDRRNADSLLAKHSRQGNESFGPAYKIVLRWSEGPQLLEKV